MDDGPYAGLSRRERQIIDVIYRDGGATASQIREEIPGTPSYSAVRALLRIMEEKGYVTRSTEEGRYVFRPTVPRRRAARSAMRHLVDTFFEGSAESAVANLLGDADEKLPPDALERLAQLVKKARSEGR